MNQHYIATDPVATWAVENALQEMGKQPALSAVLLDGPPGCGKTFLAKVTADKIKARLVYFQCFPGVAKSELIFDRDLSDRNKLIEGVLPVAIRLSLQQKVALVIDELDKAQPEMDSFLLGFLNDNLLYVPQLGELRANAAQLMVFFTKNDRREVTEPLMRRCRCVTMRWPTVEVEDEILKQIAPGSTEALRQILISAANKIRENPNVQKKPSTPELARLARDLRAMGDTVSDLILGRYAINGLVPRESDLRHFTESAYYWGSSIREALNEASSGE